jgi:serine phosphatase RsbU (regulator of sigma subunit)
LKNVPRPSSQALAEAIIADVAAYQGAAHQSDDITVLTVGYRG